MNTLSRRSFLNASAVAGLAAGGATLLGGCSSGGSSSATSPSLTKVGFDHPFNNVPLWSTLMKFAQRAADTKDVQLLKSVDNADLQTQLANLQTWIAQRVPAFTVLPLEAKSLAPIAKQAKAAGLTWVTYGSDMDNQSGSILLNNTQSGQLLGQTAGEWIQKNLGGRANVVHIDFREGGTIGVERGNGVVAGLAKAAPNATIVATQSASDPAGGNKVVSTILASRKDIDVVLCYNDDSASGAVQAFVNAGYDKNDPKIFVGGQDGSQEALKAIQAGSIFRATSALRISELSEACVTFPIQIAKKQVSNTSMQAAVTALTADQPALLATYLSDFS